ncbi:MAG: PAS domain-containing sensor histidine kinase [Bacteroidetes bacterium]|nr:PAS domain-containing sensor histidine kinase [Bacteroidota bacterium]
MGRKPAKKAVFEMKKNYHNEGFKDKEVWQNVLMTSFNYCSEALILMNYKGGVCLTNPAAKDLFGYDDEELRALSIENLLKSVYDAKIKVTIPDLLNGHNKNIQAIRKDNHVFPVNIRMKSLSTSQSVYALLFVSTPDSMLIRDKSLQRRNAEIYKLKEEINRLKNHAERSIRDRTQILQETVDSLVQTQQQLRQSLNKEIKVNEKCTKFAFLISHEYRNPLGAILTSLNLIDRYGRKENSLSKPQQDHLQKARENVKQLVSVTDELLNLNTNLNNGHKLKTTEVVISDLLNEISQNWIRMGEKGQNVPIRLNVTGKIIVETNGDLLKQALNNLISNAVKYSDANGEVVIDCDEDKDTCLISVKDQGRGIPKDELHKLSNGFYRATNSKGIAGNGLGLFIVRQFLEHLNGKLELVSELDLGTCATIRLPKKYEEKSIVN